MFPFRKKKKDLLIPGNPAQLGESPAFPHLTLVRAPSVCHTLSFKLSLDSRWEETGPFVREQEIRDVDGRDPWQ